ncbi:hypothetical protein BT96DRAFT_918208 [Gymnopus androsaceus JB14]|uniref:Uncharacterized protein n=1 Tax=Gymnopus androsaceus JB14 TaxID=1447944 RepID=A0A6A4I0A1_9AGAR|nr:hypothetical protein BT96DRAFT_918208 [Gymnopus androsaceus JB14]
MFVTVKLRYIIDVSTNIRQTCVVAATFNIIQSLLSHIALLLLSAHKLKEPNTATCRRVGRRTWVDPAKVAGCCGK